VLPEGGLGRCPDVVVHLGCGGGHQLLTVGAAGGARGGIASLADGPHKLELFAAIGAVVFVNRHERSPGKVEPGLFFVLLGSPARFFENVLKFAYAAQNYVLYLGLYVGSND